LCRVAGPKFFTARVSSATLFYLHLRSLAEVAIFFPHYSNLLIDNQEREKGKCKKKAARISKKKACAKRKAALIKIGK
jgi:hypothetical protein